jgi:hypothetical protein
MADMTRACIYFEQPGKANTPKVLKAVVARLAEGDIKAVVVASTTGYTARLFAEAWGEWKETPLISVAESALIREWGAEYPSISPDTKRELGQRGVIVADKAPYIFHNSVIDHAEWRMATPEYVFRETMYCFGQGVKVAVEVVLIAVAMGFLEPFQKVIGVGGTSRGADTALVLSATYPNFTLAKDPGKRLRIAEILCRPMDR